MASGWTADDLPDFSGRTVIVTGANSGLGLETTRELARAGAHVVLACRRLASAKTAIETLAKDRPESEPNLEALDLDLASLGSVQKFADAFLASHSRLDILCNNAGVMAVPRRETADGFELQLGTNHLGHFALTGLLLERILATPNARIVTLSSTAHKAGQIRFDDLHWKRGYGKWRAYAQSKLANLLFSYELQHKLDAARSNVRSVACHPGYAATNLQFAGPRMSGSSLMERVMEVANGIFSQSAAMGALPTLCAAGSPDVRGGEYYGPDGFMENTGHPVKVDSTARSRDREAAARLWKVSEELTGVRYDALSV